MKILAFLLAFGTEVPIPTREILIPSADISDTPTEDEMLGLAFQYGQNDFQPHQIRSLSVGDVVKLPDGSLHRVLGMGWEHLPPGTDVTKLERGRAACLIDAKLKGLVDEATFKQLEGAQ